MKYSAIAIFAIFGCELLAQQPQESKVYSNEETLALMNAKLKLAIDIKLDKLAYFPSEEIRVALTAKNLSNDRIQVPNPFSPALVRVMYPHLEHGLFGTKLTPDLLVAYGPGEVRTYQMDSSSSNGPGFAHFEPGTRKLVYTYNYSTVKVEVMDGDLEVLYEIPAQEMGVEARARQQIRKDVQLFHRLFSIRAQNLSHLCVSVGTRMSLTSMNGQQTPFISGSRSEARRIMVKGKLSELTSQLGPMRCVDTSALPIESIEGTYGNDGSMLVIATNSSGQMQKILLDKSNSVIR